MKSKKEIVSAFIHETANEKNYFFDEVYEFISKHMISNASWGKKIGIEGHKNMWKQCIHTFPDYSIKMLRLEEYKHAVVLKGIASGHHSRYLSPIVQDEYELLANFHFIKRIDSIEPKEKKVSFPIDVHFLFENEKIVFCDFTGFDLTDFFQQLGYPLKNPEHLNPQILYQNLKELNNELRNSTSPPLSPKEIECLCLNLNGFSAKQIGSLMSISYRTVQTHIQHSFDKLQCFNKYQCLEMMYENGFLPIWRDLFNLLIKQYPTFR